jgi:hypothetical protein
MVVLVSRGGDDAAYYIMSYKFSVAFLIFGSLSNQQAKEK